MLLLDGERDTAQTVCSFHIYGCLLDDAVSK
jgi:hypothetical protein